MSLDDLDSELGLLGNPAGSAPVMPASALLEYAPVAVPIISGFAGWQVGLLMAASTTLGLGIGAGGVGTGVYLLSESAPAVQVQYVTEQVTRDVPVAVDMQGPMRPMRSLESSVVETVYIEGRCEEPTVAAQGTAEPEEPEEVELDELAMAAAEMDPEWLSNLFTPTAKDVARDPTPVAHVEDQRPTAGVLRARLGIGTDTAAGQDGSRLAALGPRLGGAGLYYFGEDGGTPWVFAGVGATLVAGNGGGKLSPSASVGGGYAWIGPRLAAEIGWDLTPRYVPSRQLPHQPRPPARGEGGEPQSGPVDVDGFATLFTGPTIGFAFGQDHNVHLGAAVRAGSVPTPNGSTLIPAFGASVGVQPRIATKRKN